MKTYHHLHIILANILLTIILNSNSINAQNNKVDKLKKDLDKLTNNYAVKAELHGLSYCVILPNNTTITACVGNKGSVAIDSSMRWMFASCTKT